MIGGVFSVISDVTSPYLRCRPVRTPPMSNGDFYVGTVGMRGAGSREAGVEGAGNVSLVFQNLGNQDFRGSRGSTHMTVEDG